MPGAFAVAEAALGKLIARGVKVAVCNLAITISSGMVAQKTGLKHEDVKRDWIDAVFAGIQVVPSGVVACNGAASRGCAYIFAG
jgi:intracellular sulfur oxidation DsrE/DsrF family protein